MEQFAFLCKQCAICKNIKTSCMISFHFDNLHQLVNECPAIQLTQNVYLTEPIQMYMVPKDDWFHLLFA